MGKITNKCQYIVDGERYLPAGISVSTLPPGYYSPADEYPLGVHLVRKSVVYEEPIIFPDSVVSEILANIDRFWASRDIYEQYGFVYKRGILLYGVPGTGKTSVINAISSTIIRDMNGVVISINDSDELQRFKKVSQYIRDIEPNTPIVLTFEDIDNLFGGDDESLLLNLLDGKFQLDNIVYIATTNYPDRLAERIINRPSRFDLVREIDLPNAEVRHHYLVSKLKDKDLKFNTITDWVNRTEGLTIAHIKECILSVVVQGEDFDIVMNRMKEVIKKIYKPTSLERVSKDGIGFLKNQSKL